MVTVLYAVTDYLLTTVL